MTPLFFLIPLFSARAGDAETGYFEVPVYMGTDMEEDCNHHGKVGGCVVEVVGYTSIVCKNPFGYSSKAENCLTHEWWHIMGYWEEAQLPDTYKPNQEFRR